MFFSKENEFVELVDGRKVWLSRSAAVVGVLHCVDTGGQRHVLMNKRGKECPDEIGKWCLPCGYIDHDEDGLDGFRREVFEETGVFVDMSDDRWVSAPSEDPRQPWRVNSDPVKSNRQNISLYFALGWEGGSPPEVDLSDVNTGEVEDAAWVPLYDVWDKELAFNHRSVLKEFFNVI